MQFLTYLVSSTKLDTVQELINRKEIKGKTRLKADLLEKVNKEVKLELKGDTLHLAWGSAKSQEVSASQIAGGGASA